ncbi:MAG: capsid cement protein [Caulobacter sp.]
MHPGLTKTFTAGGAIAKRRIVKLSADFTVVQGAAAADAIIGVSDMSADVASGGRVDVRLTGVAEVDAGGNITRGGLVVSDANGKAVAAAPAAGANVRVLGIALVSAVSGDVLDVLLAQGSHQG